MDYKAQHLMNKGMSEKDAVATSLKKPSGGLTDMKRSKAEIKKRNSPDKVPSYGPSDEYPYGLKVDLENESMDKLGIDLPDVGDEVTIVAKATVSNASMRKTTEGQDRSCCLQITKLKIK